MKITLAAAALIALASSAAPAAEPLKQRTQVDDATAQANADYATARAKCSSVPERNRASCLDEAKARHQAQLQGTKREHRDETPVRDDKTVPDKASTSTR